MRIELNEVEKSFGNRNVFTGLSMAITAPCLTAVIGPSGSGKSTLLGILAGLIEPTSGTRTVTLADEEPTMRTAWMLQSAPILTRRSVLDNVVLGPLSIGRGRAQAENDARSAMARLGIEALAQTPAYRVSGGERQRIVVARALATDAQLVLADEPTASLDPANRAAVCEALVEAHSAGCAVVVATHDLVVAANCIDTVDLAAPDPAANVSD